MEDIPDLQSVEGNLKDRPSRARYDKVHLTLDRKWRRRKLMTERMMREVVDVLWDAFAGSPYSWCGFYLLAPDGRSLLLGPHQDKPACSPLPMHGVCGRVARSGKPEIVPDVKALGEARVECDPDNLSGIVIPVFDKNAKVWAVFDVDSAKPAAFDEMDQRWLDRILKHFMDVEKAQGGG